MSSGDGRTAIAVFVRPRPRISRLPGAVIVHRLPHAAGVRQGRRDRHAHGDKYPASRNTNNNLAVRRCMVRLQIPVTRIGDARPARKCLNQQSRGDSRRRLSGSSAARLASKHQKLRSPAPPDSRGGCPHVVLPRAIYFISAQRPPPVNTMTRFITTNIRS